MAEKINITEWLAKAKEDPKLAAQPLIIIGGLFFAGYKVLYSPQTLELFRQERRTKKVVGDVQRLESAVQNVEDIKLDIQEKKQAWEDAQKSCYKKSQMTKFLRRVRELAKIAGVPIKSVNPQTITKTKVGEISVEELPVSIYFTGDLVKLGTFLRLIEKEEKITYIELPNLMPNASGTFEVELTPTTILIPDELVNL